MLADGSSLQRLTFTDDAAEANPDVSLDGGDIAYEHAVATWQRNIEVINVSSHVITSIADSALTSFTIPRWSPNGQQIAMIRFGYQIWISDVSTLNASPQPEVVVSPGEFGLDTYPNPFNSELQIRYDLPRAGEVELAVFNVLGQKVAVIENGMQSTGSHHALWSPKEGSGIYFVTLRTANAMRTEKVLLAR